MSKIKLWLKAELGPVNVDAASPVAIMVYRVAMVFCVALTSSIVMAANNSLGDQFDGYSVATIRSIIGCMTVGGLSGMLQRLKTELYTFGEIKHPKIFFSTNLAGTLVAGLLAVLAGDGIGMPGWMFGLTIVTASFAGVVAADFAWQEVTRRISKDGVAARSVLIEEPITPVAPDVKPAPKANEDKSEP